MLALATVYGRLGMVAAGTFNPVLARISHRPGHHSDFVQNAVHKADGKGWAGWARVEVRYFVLM